MSPDEKKELSEADIRAAVRILEAEEAKKRCADCGVLKSKSKDWSWIGIRGFGFVKEVCGECGKRYPDSKNDKIEP